MSFTTSVDLHTVGQEIPDSCRPLVSYSFRRYKSPSSATDAQADEIRGFRFNEQLEPFMTDDEVFYKVVETNWGPVTTFVYDGTRSSKLEPQDLDPPDEALQSMLEDLRSTREVFIHQTGHVTGKATASGTPHEIKRRHLFFVRPPVGDVTVRWTPWASVPVYPGKDTCSPFCPHRPNYQADAEHVPSEDELCTHRDTSAYPWIPLIEIHMGRNSFDFGEERKSFNATQR